MLFKIIVLTARNDSRIPNIYTMIKLPFKTVFLVLILLTNSSVFAQDTINSFQGSIIAGTDRMFIISFNEGEPVEAKILSIDGDGIIIKEKGGSTRKVERSNITNIEEVPFGKLGTFGVGFGVPYGTLGINLEFFVIPYLSVTGGVGTTIFSGVGYSVGLKGYFRKPGPVWRPRASVYYGINGIYAEDFNDPNNKKYSGVTAGIGQLFLWGKNGFDLDLMFLVTSGLWDEHDGGGKIKISIGYRYAF